MIAVDTNVVVRFLVGDDSNQAALAKGVFAENLVAIPHTVLLETEWVLRSTYKFARERIAASLRSLLGLHTVSCSRREAVINAIEAMAVGCDFADALHAATADPRISTLFTFDEQFAATARKAASLPPVHLVTKGAAA